MNNKELDAIVVGAGLIGLSLALGLAKQGYKVAVVDNNSEPKNTIKKSLEKTYSPRVSAISLASQSLFEELGIWQEIRRKQQYSHMEVWDKDGFGHIDFSAEPLGHIIENQVITMALLSACKTMPNIRFYYEHNISHMDASADYAELIVQPINSEQGANLILQAKCLLGADGANSRVRESFGFKYTFWDYDHIAIVANVETENPHNNTARQAFTEFGPLAFLPLSEPNHSSFVFSLQTEKAQSLLTKENSEIEKILQMTMENIYGKCSLQSSPISFPLRMRYARKWTSPHVAIVGDAAHTIHPLAGQGANLGLADVRDLLDLLQGDKNKINQFSVLRKFERKRKSEAFKTIATMQGFKSLFDGKDPLKRLCRNSGLYIANKTPTIKAFFVQQAMGSQ